MSESGFAAWLPDRVEEGNFFGTSREVTPLMLAMELRALGSRPPWWRFFRRRAWTHDFIARTNWWLTRVSLVVD